MFRFEEYKKTALPRILLNRYSKEKKGIVALSTVVMNCGADTCRGKILSEHTECKDCKKKFVDATRAGCEQPDFERVNFLCDMYWLLSRAYVVHSATLLVFLWCVFVHSCAISHVFGVIDWISSCFLGVGVVLSVYYHKYCCGTDLGATTLHIISAMMFMSASHEFDPREANLAVYSSALFLTFYSVHLVSVVYFGPKIAHCAKMLRGARDKERECHTNAAR